MIRVLCLDIEGGYGGSSRSLHESLRHIDRTKISPQVWCAQAGPITNRYKVLDIPVRVLPAMPRASTLPRLSRSIVAFARYLGSWMRSAEFRRNLVEAARSVDLIHFNHEALFGLTAWLKSRVTCPLTMHIRTNLHPGPFARMQTRLIASHIDGLVYITENEQTNFLSHLGARSAPTGRIIFNIAEPAADYSPHPAIPRDGRLVIACLAAYAWVRGIDRIIDIAAALKKTGRAGILFVIAGRMELSRSLPGDLGVVARNGGTLADYARLRNVDDSVLCLGHTSEPESVLAAADMLIKPTRENNPWGRDILEAMAAGKPVISVGTYNRFVEHGVTGILQKEFDVMELAEQIAGLETNRATISRMGNEARKRAITLCNGPARAAELEEFWSQAVSTHRDG